VASVQGIHRGVRKHLVVVVVTLLLGSALGALVPTPHAAQASGSTTRFQGDSPSEVAVAVASEVAGGDLRNLSHLLVASDEALVDASLAAGLAAFIDACEPVGSCRSAVLLTPSASLHAATARAIEASEVPASRIIVVGEQRAVSEVVRAQIARRAGWDGNGPLPVRRLGGATRFDTAAAIAEFVIGQTRSSAAPLPESFRRVVVVNGYQLADLLVASALARHNGHTLLLSTARDLPEVTAAAFDSMAPIGIIVVGGVANVSRRVENQLASLVGPGGVIQRLGGVDRFETSTLVAEQIFGESLAIFTLVSGTRFSEAASVGILGRVGAPVLFTPRHRLPAPVRTLLYTQGEQTTRVMAVGDESSVPQALLDEAMDILAYPFRSMIPRPGVGGGGGGGSGGGGAVAPLTLSVETTAPNQSVTLPLNGIVDVQIDWGGPNNCVTSVTAASQVSCFYPTVGTYNITVSAGTGTGPWLTWFGNGDNPYADADNDFFSDANRIVEVTSWGDLGLTSLSGAFLGALNVTASAEPPSTVTDVSYMFSSAAVFDQNIGHWNTSNVSNMARMFYSANAFNQPIGQWNTSRVTNMELMFSNASTFNQNLASNSATNSWDTGNVTTMWGMFEAAGAFNNGCARGDTSCELAWDTGSVTEMRSMFYGAVEFNQDIGSWDVGNVTAMSNMFQGATRFNQDIGSWDVGNVTATDRMFIGAEAFNNGCAPGVANCPMEWDTSRVSMMSEMFREAVSFNQNIASNSATRAWDTGNVTNMREMFYEATVFNGSIGNWDTSNVVDMKSMFLFASAFNQNLGTWDTSSVTTMEQMFFFASAFNGDIGGWNTNNVVNMRSMFFLASAFNRNIGGWITSNVTDMGAMFLGASSFNQNIGGWDTSNVIYMNSMFLDAASFNQNIGGWNTGNVRFMGSMFEGATVFNQNLSGWCVSLIGSPPVDFATNAAIAGTAAFLPVWGTCPP
jgi:surface protein